MARRSRSNHAEAEEVRRWSNILAPAPPLPWQKKKKEKAHQHFPKIPTTFTDIEVLLVRCRQAKTEVKKRAPKEKFNAQHKSDETRVHACIQRKKNCDFSSPSLPPSLRRSKQTQSITTCHTLLSPDPPSSPWLPGPSTCHSGPPAAAWCCRSPRPFVPLASRARSSCLQDCLPPACLAAAAAAAGVSLQMRTSYMKGFIMRDTTARPRFSAGRHLTLNSPHARR